MSDSAINWTELNGPTAWSNALKTLQQAATQALGGTLASRQAVEQELTNFWTIPCPYSHTINQAKSLFNQLALVDLGQLIIPPPQPTALAGQSLRSLAPQEAEVGQQIIQSLAALHEQHQKQLVSQLQISQQFAALQVALRQILPPII